jgi:hypothetical protein
VQTKGHVEVATQLRSSLQVWTPLPLQRLEPGAHDWQLPERSGTHASASIPPSVLASSAADESAK